MKSPSLSGLKLTVFNKILMVVLLVAISLLAFDAVLADPEPQSVTWHTTLTLYSGNSLTAALTGTAYSSVSDYGIQDCYQSVDATLVQTVTGSLQHSPDAVNWVTLYSFPAVTTDTVSFTRTVIYGGYERYLATLANANPVTLTLKCTLKDNGG